MVAGVGTPIEGQADLHGVHATAGAANTEGDGIFGKSLEVFPFHCRQLHREIVPFPISEYSRSSSDNTGALLRDTKFSSMNTPRSRPEMLMRKITHFVSRKMRCWIALLLLQVRQWSELSCSWLRPLSTKISGI